VTSSVCSDAVVSQSSQSGATAPPRFRKIVDLISEQITSGKWAEHTALPSERSIAEEYRVSRMTARRALEALELKGLVYNEDRRGRFVSPKRLIYKVGNMVSFLKDSQAKGTELQIEVLSTLETLATGKLAKQLQVPTGEPLYQYTRLFRSNGHATFIETESIVAKRFEGFLHHDLHQSTTGILETHYNTRATTGDIVIRMRSANDKEALLLGLGNSQPGIELEQVISDHNGEPFCFGSQLWRGELAEFTARAMVNPE